MEGSGSLQLAAGSTWVDLHVDSSGPAQSNSMWDGVPKDFLTKRVL